MSNTDWKLLRGQKKDLCEVCDNLQKELSELSVKFKVATKQLHSLEGILSLIDHIQDEAEAGGENVFEEDEDD